MGLDSAFVLASTPTKPAIGYVVALVIHLERKTFSPVCPSFRCCSIHGWLTGRKMLQWREGERRGLELIMKLWTRACCNRWKLNTGFEWAIHVHHSLQGPSTMQLQHMLCWKREAISKQESEARLLAPLRSSWNSEEISSPWLSSYPLTPLRRLTASYRYGHLCSLFLSDRLNRFRFYFISLALLCATLAILCAKAKPTP